MSHIYIMFNTTIFFNITRSIQFRGPLHSILLVLLLG